MKSAESITKLVGDNKIQARSKLTLKMSGQPIKEMVGKFGFGTTRATIRESSTPRVARSFVGNGREDLPIP